MVKRILNAGGISKGMDYVCIEGVDRNSDKVYNVLMNF